LPRKQNRARFLAARWTVRFRAALGMTRGHDSPRGASRLCVTSGARFSSEEPLLRVAQIARSLLLLASNSCEFAPNMRAICSIKEGDVICFQ